MQDVVAQFMVEGVLLMLPRLGPVDYNVGLACNGHRESTDFGGRSA